jgi:hypothetical protein
MISFAFFFFAVFLPVYSQSADLRLPLLSLEIAPVLALVAAMTWFLARLADRCGPRARAILITSAITLFLDLQFGGKTAMLNLMPFEGHSDPFRLAMWILAAAPFLFSAYLAIRALRRNDTRILSVFFVATFVSAFVAHFFDESADAERRRAHPAAASKLDEVAARKLPLILHIVTDEFASPSALPSDVPEANELRSALTVFQKELGFTFFDHVFSRYFMTPSSLVSMVNFAPGKLDFATHMRRFRHPDGTFAFKVLDNRYFESLARVGYNIRVHQNKYMDFCDEKTVSLCETYFINNPLDEGVANRLPFLDRMLNALRASINADSFTRRLMIRGVNLAFSRAVILPHHGPLAALSVLDGLPAEIAAAPPGTAFFVHLLLPHQPWMLDANCGINVALPGTESGTGEGLESHLKGLEDVRRARYANYSRQSLCLVSALTRLFKDPLIRDKLKDAIVVIHGDHGSRNVRPAVFKDPNAELSSRDLVDLYATFFAIRRPHSRPGIEPMPVSLQELFARSFQSGHVDSRSDAVKAVVVNSDLVPQVGGLPSEIREIPMPRF